MGQVLAVISGKGGTGKTTLCAGVAACLAAEGQRVLCIDGDIGLRNLDIALGMSDLFVLPFTDILHGHATLSDATCHPQIPNLSLLTAPIRENAELISQEAFGALLQQARKVYDWCLIDAAAGIGAGFRLATRFADQIVVVATPDPACLRDATCAADLLALDNKDQVKLVVNRVEPKLFARMELTVDDLMDGVGLPLLGIVPEDPNGVLAAAGNTALILNSGKGASVACLHIARRLCGRREPLMKIR